MTTPESIHLLFATRVAASFGALTGQHPSASFQLFLASRLDPVYDILSHRFGLCLRSSLIFLGGGSGPGARLACMVALQFGAQPRES